MYKSARGIVRRKTPERTYSKQHFPTILARAPQNSLRFSPLLSNAFHDSPLFCLRNSFPISLHHQRVGVLPDALHITHQPYRGFRGSCDESNSVDEKTSAKEGSPCDGSENLEPVTKIPSEAESHKNATEEETSQCGGEGKSSFGNKPPDKDKKKGITKINPLKTKFKKMVIAWDKIDDSFEDFPYYLNEHTKNMLVEMGTAQMKHQRHRKYCKSLRASSRFVLLTGSSGTEIYQEKLVRALANNLRTSLLVLDTDDLIAQHSKQDQGTQSDSGEEVGGSIVEEGELWAISSTDDETRNNKEDSPNKRVIPAAKIVHTFGQIVGLHDQAPGTKGSLKSDKVEEQDDDEDSEEESQSNTVKIGDRVKFVGGKDEKGMQKRKNLRVGQEGFVISVSDTYPEKIGVRFELNGNKKAGVTKKKNAGSVTICDVSEIERVELKHSETEPWMNFIEAIYEMSIPSGGLIVYFPDLRNWMAKAVPRDERNLFLHMFAESLESTKGSVIFIAGCRKDISNANNVNVGQWHPLKNLLSSMRGTSFKRVKIRGGDTDTKGSEEVFETFKNVIPILPPQEPDKLRHWREQLDQDKKKMQSRSNLREIEKVLVENAMSCAEVADINTSDLILSEKQAQKIVGWARNICLSADKVQQKGRTLSIPKESMEIAVSRLQSIEKSTTDKINDIKVLAENDYEAELAASVIRAKDIGITFDQIGALEDVKTTLNELIILPMKRPELFSKGNLRKPCKGVLLFGPPGTGKTLLAKAVATEAGANFMSINASSINSKWFGEAEKLAKGIFTLARKLEPTIIFIDEVDGILRARGDASEHEASRRVRNELMAAWDGLQTKETERILVLATTNRPFDLDDAVVRRLPRRIFIDLPDIQNRDKILRVLLAEEELDYGFDYRELAAQTEGFSGSDLKNLCVAAAYRPIQEFLEAEKRAMINESNSHITSNDHVSLRPLCVDDFIQAKKKVGTSVTYDASTMVQMRQWNEQYGEGGSRMKSVFGFIK